MEESKFLQVYPRTLFDDLLLRVHVSQGVVPFAFAAIGLLALLGAAYLDGIIIRLLESDFLRVLLLQPTIVFYILLLQFFLEPSRVGVTDAFRKMMGMDPVEYHRFLVRISPLRRRSELIALLIGAVIGVGLPLEWMLPDQYRWTNLYLSFSEVILFALGVWGVYSSLAVTRLFTRLHHQKLEIDLFHPTFVDAIARRSLAITMVYVGAIALSVFFFPPQTFRNVTFFAIVYAILILLSGFIFLFSMYESHCLLVETKCRELDIVRRHLSEDYRQLKEHKDSNLANWVTAWLAYEKRLLEAPEWPFNPETIRNLVAAMLVPIGTLAARVLAERF
jgi:hypothetical protein